MGDYYTYASQHATKRMLDRHGVSATRAIWRAAFLSIVDGRSVLVARQPNGRERHLLRIGGVAVLAIYEPRAAQFVTVLA